MISAHWPTMRWCFFFTALLLLLRGMPIRLPSSQTSCRIIRASIMQRRISHKNNAMTLPFTRFDKQVESALKVRADMNPPYLGSIYLNTREFCNILCMVVNGSSYQQLINYSSLSGTLGPSRHVAAALATTYALKSGVVAADVIEVAKSATLPSQPASELHSIIWSLMVFNRNHTPAFMTEYCSSFPTFPLRGECFHGAGHGVFLVSTIANGILEGYSNHDCPQIRLCSMRITKGMVRAAESQCALLDISGDILACSSGVYHSVSMFTYLPSQSWMDVPCPATNVELCFSYFFNYNSMVRGLRKQWTNNDVSCRNVQNKSVLLCVQIMSFFFFPTYDALVSENKVIPLKGMALDPRSCLAPLLQLNYAIEPYMSSWQSFSLGQRVTSSAWCARFSWSVLTAQRACLRSVNKSIHWISHQTKAR